jgi:hypothetical protein
MPRAAARALRRGDRLTLRVTSFLDPGEAAGVLPAEDRVRLSARARRASPDR